MSCRPVARFQYLVGHNTFLGGKDFCFYYILKTHFSGRNKIWGGARKKFGGALPPNAPPSRGYGPDVLSRTQLIKRNGSKPRVIFSSLGFSCFSKFFFLKSGGFKI